MKINKLLAVAAIALIGCGDNKAAPDARVKDSGAADAYCSNCPAAPTPGNQIDRMGRPAVNTVLNRGFDSPQIPAVATAKQGYNEQSVIAMWATYIPEFMSNLAIADVLDTGICGNGICEENELVATCAVDCTGTACNNGTCERGETNATCPGDCPTAGQIGSLGVNGCGNQAMYVTPTGPTSYGPLATLLSNDQFFLDTTKTTCAFYLAVEFGVVLGGTNSTCGGRAPQYDVIDYSFSMLTMGLKGFDTNLQPLFKDNAPVHTDYLTDFPYLGTPH